jgi:hypothetical protein
MPRRSAAPAARRHRTAERRRQGRPRHGRRDRAVDAAGARSDPESDLCGGRPCGAPCNRRRRTGRRRRPRHHDGSRDGEHRARRGAAPRRWCASSTGRTDRTRSFPRWSTGGPTRCPRPSPIWLR